MTDLTRNEAMKLDKAEGEFYIDREEELDMVGVFGSESGFCYFLDYSEERCEEYINNYLQ